MKVDLHVEPEQYALVYKNHRTGKQWQGVWVNVHCKDPQKDTFKVQTLYQIKKRAYSVRRLTIYPENIADAINRHRSRNLNSIFDYKIFFEEVMQANGFDRSKPYLSWNNEEFNTLIIEQRIP